MREEIIKNCRYIEYDTFKQILEMDDDEIDRDFSKEIVVAFFTQAESTIKEIKRGVEARDLEKLSSLGHYLKGSSATLGLTKVKESCEAIQHLGVKLDEPGNRKINDDQECLNRIEDKLAVMSADYQSVKKVLKEFYGMSGEAIETP